MAERMVGVGKNLKKIVRDAIGVGEDLDIQVKDCSCFIDGGKLSGEAHITFMRDYEEDEKTEKEVGDIDFRIGPMVKKAAKKERSEKVSTDAKKKGKKCSIRPGMFMPTVDGTKKAKKILTQYKFQKKLINEEVEILEDLSGRHIDSMTTGERDKIVNLFNKVARRLTGEE